jgi:glycosyltransferase involved in cell wall biosynthesis
MENKVSVIIPTMFRCVNITNNLLESLYEDPSVSEVIIIDNTEDQSNIDKITVNEKLQIHSQGKNIYVNPAWNLGVSIAKEDIIAIINDDVTIPNNLFSALSQVDFKEIGIVGACHPTIQQVECPVRFNIENAELFAVPERMWGYGIFMAMHKNTYINIPEDMLVWCGDDYLFHQNKSLKRQNYVLVCPIQTKMSVTSDDPVFDKVKEKDLEMYNLKYKIA